MEDSSEPYYLLLNSFINPLSFEVVIGLLIMVVLLICSGLISGSEIAYFSLEPSDKKELEENPTGVDKLIIQLIDGPKSLLATILIANNFINVAIIILSTIIMDSLFYFGDNKVLAFLIQVVIVTFLILLAGEVIPKVYANQHSLQIAKLMAYPIHFMKRFFKPLSFLLITSTSIIDKRFNKRSNSITVDELEHALELTTESDADEEEQKILKGIVKFGNTSVKQVMTPRMDVISIDIKTPFSELLQEILTSGFSRIPVFEESFDNIKGVVYIKDVLSHLEKDDTFKWQKLKREAFFVPENKKIDDLLKDFQERKIHIAIVVDEYGGTSGIVSLEDVIEEIVGEISDEFDTDDIVYSKLDERNYIFEGKILLNDLYKIIAFESPEIENAKGDAETLAGFILEINEKIPKPKEEIKFHNFIFKIESADDRKISSVKVTLTNLVSDNEH